MSGITSAEGIMENARATNQLTATLQKGQFAGAGGSTWIYGVTYPNNQYAFGGKELRSNLLTYIKLKEKESSLTRFDVNKMGVNFGKILNTSRIPMSKAEKARRRAIRAKRRAAEKIAVNKQIVKQERRQAVQRNITEMKRVLAS